MYASRSSVCAYKTLGLTFIRFVINKHRLLWDCHLEYVTKTVKSQILKLQTLRKASPWDLLKYFAHHQKYTLLT